MSVPFINRISPPLLFVKPFSIRYNGTMKIREAVSTLQIGKKKGVRTNLLTRWGRALDPDSVLQEYPRPQMVRDSYINLNGYWEYAFTGLQDDREMPAVPDGRILVPFSPETLLSGVGRQLSPDSLLWYRRTWTIPQLPAGQHLLLNFGAVDQICVIYINGNEAGRHFGGYLSFSVDITSFLVQGENTIAVRVRDISDTSWMDRGKQKLKPGGMFYTAQSGIWQTVWAEWVPENHILSLKITPHFDEQYLALTVRTVFPCRISVLLDRGPSVPFEGQSGNELRIPVPDMHPWSPEDPYLYPFTVRAENDTVRSYFAMRKFSVGKDRRGIPFLFLNNRPYFQDGVLDQGYWSDGLYTAPSDEAMVFDIRSMKELGFNMIRKHIKVEPMRWYYHCDRLGMIVWQDMLNGGGRSLMTFMLYLPTALPFVTSRFPDSNYPIFSRASAAGRRAWIRGCRDTMKQLYNVPCIGLWTAFNEGWGQFDAKKVWEMMKKWDATRPVDHASGWYDQGCGDIVSYHNYWRALKVKPEKRPFCFSEYGGLSFRAEGHCWSSVDFSYTKAADLRELKAAFLSLRKEIRSLYGKGLAAAVYTQVSDVEEEVNGILTFDREINKLG